MLTNNYEFELFKKEISDDVRTIYNKYQNFKLAWESKAGKERGFIDFIPYGEIYAEHKNLCDEVSDVEQGIIDEQEKVLDDIYHWYPVISFPNGDKFCYDDRNGKIVF